MISIGGLAVIGAVLGIFAFLVLTVVPLFRGADVSGGERVVGEVSLGPGWVFIDEYALLATLVSADARYATIALSDGRVVEQGVLGEGVTAVACSPVDETVALGLAGGSIQLGRIGYGTSFVPVDGLPDGALGLEVGEHAVVDGGVVHRVTDDQYRRVSAEIELNEPKSVEGEGEIAHIDYRTTAKQSFAVVLRDAAGPDGTNAVYSSIRFRRALGGLGETRVSLTSASFRIVGDPELGMPGWVFATADGNSVLALWESGLVARYAVLRDGGTVEVVPADTRSVIPAGSDERVTSAELLVGGRTLLVGTDAGRVYSIFPATDRSAGTPDRVRLVTATSYEMGSSAVTSIGLAHRERSFAASDESGGVHVRHTTSGKRIADVRYSGADDARAVLCGLSPRGDALFVLDEGGGYRVWGIEPRHPEASVSALFGAVWYEGTLEPSFTYQSSAGEDQSEPKLSLVPLMYGTLKATVYAMLFALPLAIFSAIYTSEMLHPRVRNAVKPVVESMASLPSVVLGFVAGLVVAPWARDHLAAILLSFYVVPVGVLLGAHLWQMFPIRLRSRLRSWQSLLLVMSVSVVSLGAAWAGAPLFERVLFADPASGRADIEGWLNGSFGSAMPGWVVFLTAPSMIVASIARGRLIDPLLTRTSLPRAGLGAGVFEFGKFLLTLGGGFGVAVVLASVLSGSGLDTRDSVFGDYSQRNSLVVGMIMGFAVIPIIYTIAEDALSSVSNSLRSASLGAGATKWQTAVRVVLPVAASGIFSAAMIGLGRAVGETMIVLMATGNTPIMEANIFSGFRTLAANIAVELPEAAQGSTHYRILFLCGLVLFVMTFCINTLAEVVRQRFRRRAAAL